VWFYYCDFIAESGVTAPILVGAVFEPRCGWLASGYAAATVLRRFAIDVALRFAFAAARSPRPPMICTDFASGLMAR
jgi:hypothetical protein